MSTFRQEMVIVLDGQDFKVTTCANDHMAAEIMTAKTGATIETNPISHGFRIAFQAFKRTYPDDPLAVGFGTFSAVLDEIASADQGEDTPAALDPTHPAASDA
jgi:hypothetical protein